MNISYQEHGVEVIENLLEYLACGGPESLEEDEFEFIGEDEEGREGSCDISITNLANEAHEALVAQRQRIAELERIAAQFKEAALKASANGYGQDEVHHDDSWIEELDEALRKIQLYDAKRAKVA